MERKRIKSNQFENETVTPENVRQFLLAELNASQQVIASLSDEELETITGGTLGGNVAPPTAESSSASAERANFLKKFNRSYSAPALLQGHQATPWEGPYPKRLQDYVDSFKGLGQRKNS